MKLIRKAEFSVENAPHPFQEPQVSLHSMHIHSELHVARCLFLRHALHLGPSPLRLTSPLFGVPLFRPPCPLLRLLCVFIRHTHDFQPEFAVAKTHFSPSNRRFCGMLKLLVWYGGAAAIRGGHAGDGSHIAGCAVHPSTPVQPTSITTSSQRLSQPIQEVGAYSAPVKSRSNSKSRIETRMAGLLDSNKHYLF